MQKILVRAAKFHKLKPRCDEADFARHVYRELNGEADSLANRHSYAAGFNISTCRYPQYRLFFDGSVSQGGCGGGWVLFGRHGGKDDLQDTWHRVAWLSFPMEISATITVCEMEACVWGVVFAVTVLEDPDQAAAILKEWQPLSTDKFPVLELAQLVQ